jgi:hypothetical protein
MAFFLGSSVCFFFFRFGLPPIPFLFGFFPIRHKWNRQSVDSHSLTLFLLPPIHSRQFSLVAFNSEGFLITTPFFIFINAGYRQFYFVVNSPFYLYPGICFFIKLVCLYKIIEILVLDLPCHSFLIVFCYPVAVVLRASCFLHKVNPFA